MLIKSIMFVVPSSIYGGGEVYVKNFINYLKKNTSIKIFVGVCNERLGQELKTLADDVFFIRSSDSNLNKLINVILINLYLIRKGISVIFLNGLPESGLFSFLTFSKNLICIGHSNEHHLRTLNNGHSLKKIVLKYLYRISFHRFKLFIAINKKAKSSVDEFISNYTKCRVIYNGVPPVIANSLNKSTSMKSQISKLVVGRMSRLVKDKNIELAIDSVAAAGPNFELLVAGEGPHLRNLQRYAEQIPTNHVSFLGYCAADEFFSRIDVMLLTTPSYSNADATPLVILEAMSAGVPVIATKVGGVSELICHMENGILCDDDPDSFSKALRLIASDKNLVKKLVTNAKAHYIEKYSSDVCFNKTILAIRDYCEF